MTDPSFFLLYVDDLAISAAFYAALLGKLPVESSSSFTLFELSCGARLGLWARLNVQPTASIAGGASELGIALEDDDAVDRCHADWQARGLCIIQRPTNMVFGRTFVALDPDGHRLRVFSPCDT
jgi:predicted enzyme related to lactoylglutathione lyase